MRKINNFIRCGLFGIDIIDKKAAGCHIFDPDD